MAKKAKKKTRKKSKADFSLVALDVVEAAIGESLITKKPRKKSRKK